MASDDEDEGLSFRASLSRERSALITKLLNSKDGGNGFITSDGTSTISPKKGPRTSSLKAQAFLKAAVPLRSPTNESSDQSKPNAGTNQAKFFPLTEDPPIAPKHVSPVSTSSMPPKASSAVRAAAAAGLQRRMSSREQSTDSRPASNGGDASRRVHFSNVREASSTGSALSSSQTKPPNDVPDQTKRKQSIVKAAQVFGDPSLVDSAPKSLRATDGTQDLKAKVMADQQFVMERSQARQQRMKEALEAQPTAEQLSLPEAQRTRKASVKAMQVLGSERLDREMQQNLGGLPYDPTKPQNKATRTLGSVGTLAQPKVEKVLGPSSDAEDAQTRNLARASWDKQVSQRKSLGNGVAARVLRKFGSSAASTTTTVAEHQQLAPIASIKPVPKSTFAAKAPSLLSSASNRLSFRASSGTSTPKANGADLDKQIKDRQEADESKELAALLNRFG